MEDWQAEELIGQLFDTLASAIQWSLAQKAALETLSPDGHWLIIAQEAQEHVVRVSHGPLAELRRSLVSAPRSSDGKVSLPADWQDQVRRIVEGADDSKP